MQINVCDVLDILPNSIRKMVVDSDVRFLLHNAKDLSQMHYRSLIYTYKDYEYNEHIWGFYSSRKNIIHLRKDATFGVTVHEIGHALDWYLGNGYWRSCSSKSILDEFNKKEAINKTSNGHVIEFFAEGFRAFLNINDPIITNYDALGFVSREKLKQCSPYLEDFFSKTFDM